jgi:hypothetical protein
MPESTEYYVECWKCNTKVVAIQMTQTLEDFRDDPFEPNWYVVVQCRICYSPMLIQQPRDAPHDRAKTVLLWPISNREMSSAIPESLRLEHKEALACFKSGAYTATVVMVRRTLEGVCAENGVRGHTLFKALERMRATGLIEGRLLEWAQELRVLGNEGAHFTGERVARQDAQDALALAEAILDYLYVFSAQFFEFKNRRELRATSEQDGLSTADDQGDDDG